MGKILLLIMNLAVLVHGILSLTGGMSYGAAALTSAIVYGGGLLLLPEVARHGKGILLIYAVGVAQLALMALLTLDPAFGECRTPWCPLVEGLRAHAGGLRAALLLGQAGTLLAATLLLYAPATPSAGTSPGAGDTGEGEGGRSR